MSRRTDKERLSQVVEGLIKKGYSQVEAQEVIEYFNSILNK